MNQATDYTPTALGYAIMGLLHQQPQSGYEIRMVFETTPMRHFSGSPGSIYPALKRLQNEGLIDQTTQPGPSASAKKKFSLTEAGVAALTEWLRLPVTRSDVINDMPNLILRFAFMTDEIQLEERTAFLDDFKKEVDAYIDELATFREAMTGSLSLHGLLALDRGIANYKADSEWAASASITIKSEY